MSHLFLKTKVKKIVYQIIKILISLLSYIGKIMERCIFKYVHKFLLKNVLITKFPSGFRPGDFTVNQLISFSNDFGKTIDDGKEIRLIFCDISKAFDRVWHKCLLYKLKTIGIDDTCLFLFALIILLIIFLVILTCLQMTLRYTLLLIMNMKLPISLIKMSKVFTSDPKNG